MLKLNEIDSINQKQPSKGVLRKRCSENMQQSNFVEITLQHGCSLVNLLHIFRTPFPKKISGEMLLKDPLPASNLHLYHKQ